MKGSIYLDTSKPKNILGVFIISFDYNNIIMYL